MRHTNYYVFDKLLKSKTLTHIIIVQGRMKPFDKHCREAPKSSEIDVFPALQNFHY